MNDPRYPWGPHGERYDTPQHALPNPTPPTQFPIATASDASTERPTWEGPVGPAQPLAVASPRPKRLWLAILLVLVIGPLGLFYTSIIGGLIMLLLFPLVAAVLIVMLGGPEAAPFASTAVIPLSWIGSLFWAVIAARAHNAKYGF